MAERADRGERDAGTDARPGVVLGGDAGIPSPRHAARRARRGREHAQPAQRAARPTKRRYGPGSMPSPITCWRTAREDRARSGRNICARLHRGRSTRGAVPAGAGSDAPRAARTPGPRRFTAPRGGREAARRRSPDRRTRRRRQRDGAWHRSRSQRAAQRRGFRQPRDGRDSSSSSVPTPTCATPPSTRRQSPGRGTTGNRRSSTT